jgi:hypothetical protein
MRTRVCSKCGEEKNFDTEFTRNRESKGGRLPFCRTCKAKEDREYYLKNTTASKERARKSYHDNKEQKLLYIKNYQRDKKLEAIAVKGSKCEQCGFTHPAALQFHHRDPQTKMFDITSKTLSAPRKFPWETILQEIEKCDLLCANCHAVEHSTWELEVIEHA